MPSKFRKKKTCSKACAGLFPHRPHDGFRMAQTLRGMGTSHIRWCIDHGRVLMDAYALEAESPSFGHATIIAAGALLAEELGLAVDVTAV